MSDIFREELKEHCKRQMKQFTRVKAVCAVSSDDWKRYEEHKYVLGMIEKLEKIEKIVAEWEEDSKGFRDYMEEIKEVLNEEK